MIFWSFFFARNHLSTHPSIIFFLNKVVIPHRFKFLFVFSLYSLRLRAHDCHRILACMVVIVLMQWVVVSSWCNVMIFVIVVKRLFMFERFK